MAERPTRNVGFVRHSGKAADVERGSTANRTNVLQRPCLNRTNEMWIFSKTGDGQYEIKGLGSGKLLEAAGLSRADGGNVAIWGDANAAGSTGSITPTGDGYYSLINRYSGLCLAVDAGSTADGANIGQQPYPSLTRQQWQIIAV